MSGVSLSFVQLVAIGFFALGTLLFFSGLGIVRIEKITIARKRITWISGLVFMVMALVLVGRDIGGGVVSPDKPSEALHVCYDQRRPIDPCDATGRQPKYRYQGCTRQTLPCQKTDQKSYDDQSIFATSYQAEVAYTHCLRSYPFPPKVTTLKPDPKLGFVLPPDVSADDYSLSLTHEMEVPVHKRPFVEEKITARLSPGAQYIKANQCANISGTKWLHISCYDRYRNEYRGWIKYTMLKEIGAEPRCDGTDGEETTDSTPMITPIETKHHQSPTWYQVTGVEDDYRVNVLASAQENYTIVARIAKNGQYIDVQKKKGAWSFVSFEDGYGYRYCGWIQSKYIEPMEGNVTM